MSVFNARWIKTSEPAYANWCRSRAARRRLIKTGPTCRQNGEIIGGLVERAARHHISQQVTLQEERILTWRKSQPGYRAVTLYREIDAVQPIERGFKLFEIKLTTAENMRLSHGLSQLKKSHKILKVGMPGGSHTLFLLRLVYVAESPLESSLPTVDCLDDTTPVGIIWLTPDQIEHSASELGIQLPNDWMNPETRRNHGQAQVKTYWDSSKSDDCFGTSIAVTFRALQKQGEDNDTQKST